MKRTFFIIGGYAFGNPGDEAILKTSLENIRALYPEAHFLIWRDQKRIKFRFDRPAPFHYITFGSVLLLSNQGWIANKMRMLYRLTYPFSSWLGRTFSRSSLSIIRLMSRSDAVVFVGGGYLNSLYNLMQMHFLFRLARAAGKPVILLGQTLGPILNSRDRGMLDDICRGAAAVVVRDKHSLVWAQNGRSLKESGVDDAVCFSPKEAENALAPLRDLLAGKEKSIDLGLNLRHIEDGRERYPDLFESLERFAQSAPLPVRVFLIPMETSVYCDDRDEFGYFLKRQAERLHFKRVPDPLSVEQKQYLISQMDLVLAMRYHAQVFALSSAVPCLGIYKGSYYTQKATGLFEQFGQEKYCIPIDDSRRAADLLSELYRNKGTLRAQLAEKVAELKSRQRSIFKKVFSAVLPGEHSEK
jgi:polysaccharide pyruvyl transferase WcaK-like protein